MEENVETKTLFSQLFNDADATIKTKTEEITCQAMKLKLMSAYNNASHQALQITNEITKERLKFDNVNISRIVNLRAEVVQFETAKTVIAREYKELFAAEIPTL